MGKAKSLWSQQLEQEWFSEAHPGNKRACHFCGALLAASSKPKLSRHLAFECTELLELANEEDDIRGEHYTSEAVLRGARTSKRKQRRQPHHTVQWSPCL